MKTIMRILGFIKMDHLTRRVIVSFSRRSVVNEADYFSHLSTTFASYVDFLLRS